MGNEQPQPHRDRHRHTFMVRLPEIFRTKLRGLAEKTGKPMTSFIKTALKTFLTAVGRWSAEDDKILAQQERAALNEGPAT